MWSLFERFIKNLKGFGKIYPALLGFGLIRRSHYWIVSDLSFGTPWAIDSHMVYSICKILCFLIIMFAAPRIGSLLRTKRFVGASAWALALGTFLTYCPLETLHHPVVLCIGLLCMAVGYAVLTISWVELYCRISPLSMILTYCCSVLIGASFWANMGSLPDVVSLFIACITPFASMFMLVWGANVVPQANTTHESDKKQGIYHAIVAKMLVWVSLCALAYGMVLQSFDVRYSSLSYLGRLIFAVIVLGAIFISRNGKTLKILYRILALVLPFGLLVATLQKTSPLSLALMNLGNESYTCILYLILCATVRRKKSSAVRMAAGCIGCMSLSVFLGETLGAALNVSSSPTLIPLVGALAVAIGALSIPMFSDEDFDVLSGLGSKRENENGIRDSKLTETAARCGISKSELKVMRFMARGLSNNEISEELALAPGTIRAHVSNIYGKMNVHSRDEFLAALRSP